MTHGQLLRHCTHMIIYYPSDRIQSQLDRCGADDFLCCRSQGTYRRAHFARHWRALWGCSWCLVDASMKDKRQPWQERRGRPKLTWLQQYFS